MRSVRSLNRDSNPAENAEKNILNWLVPMYQKAGYRSVCKQNHKQFRTICGECEREDNEYIEDNPELQIWLLNIDTNVYGATKPFWKNCIHGSCRVG